MPDYRKMYHIMTGAATDAERLITKALVILSKAQMECEEIYFKSIDEPPDPEKEAAGK